METTSALSQIESTLESIKIRDAAYSELTGRFGPLFEKKEQVLTTLMGADLQSPVIDAERMAAGVPLFAEMDLTPWGEAFEQSAESLLPVLGEVLQLEPKALQQMQTHLANTENLLGFVQARVEGNWKHFEKISKQLNIAPSTLLSYIAETISASVFSAIVSTMGEAIAAILWEYSSCPICGSSPSIAQLCPKDPNASEYLVGSGGKKYLHCSLCGHDWHYKRNVCVSCGNDDSETRELLYMDDIMCERIEICHKCGKYMITVDMREYSVLPHLDTIQMGLIHLDILAHERQLSPISPTLWNSIK